MGGRLIVRKILWDIWKLRALIIIIVTPLAVLPLPLVVQTSESKAGYVVILMAVYWIFEVIPISVTALIPLVLFPLMNVVPAKDIASTYMNDTIMVFFGGLCVAIAIEVWNIHKRIALKVLMLVGTEPRWLMFGLMLSTWFLSMWISNTAATAMLVPIAEAILVQLKGTKTLAEQNQTTDVSDGYMELDDITVEEKNVTDKVKVVKNDENGVRGNESHYSTIEDEDEEDPHYKRMCKALSLCICYAANSGGIATLTGTPPNLVFKEASDSLFDDKTASSPVNFATWMAYGLPLSVLVVLFCWIWLQIYYLRCRGCCSCLRNDEEKREISKRVKAVILKEYKALGPITYAQWCVIVAFVTLVLLWISRKFGEFGGWGDLFDKGMVKDSTPPILITILLFILPSTFPDVFCLRKKESKIRNSLQPLLKWKDIQEKMPWGLFLLLGGGYALAKGCKVSGLSQWIGDELRVFKDLNPYLILLILCYICAAATEVTSNTAIANIVVPILGDMAKSTGVNPLFYMLPPTLAISFAFMLPVATPPNAIVFSYGHVRVIDMISVGFILNIVTVPLLVMATRLWGNAIFSLDVLPTELALNYTTTPIILQTA